MTATTSEYNLDEPELPRIRKLDRNAPMRWVSQGLNDLKTSRLNSIILILILLRLAWSRLVAMVLVFFFDHSTLVSGGWGALYDDANFLPFIGTFTSCGTVLAGFNISISVFTIPHLSYRKVWIWTAMLAPLVILGIGFFLIGLIFTLPLAGHASWHAYREAIIED